jgi:hypothetical protein
MSSNYFSASDHQTDTKFASKHGTAAIQLEVNSTWLKPSKGDLHERRFGELLQALVRFINAETGTSTSMGKASIPASAAKQTLESMPNG